MGGGVSRGQLVQRGGVVGVDVVVRLVQGSRMVDLMVLVVLVGVVYCRKVVGGCSPSPTSPTTHGRVVV